MTASAAYAPPTLVLTPAWDALARRLRGYSPRTELGLLVAEAFRYLPPELAGELLDAVVRSVVIESSLRCRIYRGPHSPYGPPGWAPLEDYGKGGPGITSRKLITTAGVNYLVTCWNGTNEPEVLKYHGLGTGSTAENVADTALVTELTTQYATDNVRPTGTLAGATFIFSTVGINTIDAGATIAEHGLFSQAATGGGTLWDRSLTGSQVLASGDTLQTTYNCTLAAGG